MAQDPPEPIGASFLDDPYPVYKQLRDEHPVYCRETARGSFYVLSRYDDVAAALSDWQRYSSVPAWKYPQAPFVVRAPEGGRQLIETDPPLHDRLRETVQARFSPKRVRELEGAYRAAASDLMDGLAARGRVDLARDVAWPLNLQVTSDVVGIPEDDRQQVLDWYLDVVYSGDSARALDSAHQYRQYFTELASRRAAQPASDVVSELMRLVRSGAVELADAVLLCIDLFEGGVDVPANLIGNAIVALADEPEQRQWLADPDRDSTEVRIAIEELARYDTPIQHLPRTAATDVTLHGTTIPAGSHVRLLLGAANHDERHYDDPDRLDVTRPLTRSVAFGVGVHFCIGAPLARLGVGVTLPMLLRALPTYSLAGPVERPRGADNMRALLRLEVTTSEPAREGDGGFRVVVDLDRCESHGQCVLAAPSVFELDDDLNLRYVDEPEHTRRADIERAVMLCPVHAIRIER